MRIRVEEATSRFSLPTYSPKKRAQDLKTQMSREKFNIVSVISLVFACKLVIESHDYSFLVPVWAKKVRLISERLGIREYLKSVR